MTNKNLQDIFKIKPGDHFMIDLETLDTSHSAVILSIGAIKFNPFEVQDTFKQNPYFYRVIDQKSCTDIGMTTSKSTLQFWNRQSGYAQRILNPYSANPPIDNVQNIVDCLRNLSHFLLSNSQTNKVFVWSNSSTFDISILNDAYQRIGLSSPWNSYGELCYRTIRTMLELTSTKKPTQDFQGTPHHSLHDAAHQAALLQKFLNTLLA